MHSCLDICTYRQPDIGNVYIHRCTHRIHTTKLTDLDIQVHIMHTCSFTDTHKHTEYDRHYTYICKHTCTWTHTHTHRPTDRQTHSYMQTDRQTDTHTHASNHLRESSPSVEVSQHRVVFARHQLLREKRRQNINQGSMQHFHTDSYT